MRETDFLVIGSGIAGLSFALKCAKEFPDRKVLVITKAKADETNTKYAQGGVAVVSDTTHDSIEQHVQDTLIAGDGLCNQNMVRMLVTEGPARVEEIIEWGARFDKDAAGEFKKGKEGGHSAHRILHHKDVTGLEMERALLEAVKSFSNIELIKHCFVIDLITQHHEGYLVTKSTPNITCFGVYVLNRETNAIDKILSRVTLLASGGVGQVYRTTTNPSIATGDGVAMVYRAKGKIENMEFIQFHPTALYEPGLRGQAFLITEAVRGEGAILRNHQGDDFMKQVDARKDLAPRDIVARAIDAEMKKSGMEFVWLDCTQIDPVQFKSHFPTIYEKCLSIGIDVTKQFIPVAPAAHYSCGGIQTNEWGASSIQRLYACGECASTGVHGANRLASNSLLEAMVFAHRCFDHARTCIDTLSYNYAIPEWSATGTTDPKEMILITQSLKELQQIMSDYVGIVRNDIRLQRASRRLDLLWEETEQLYQNTTVSPQLLELRNMITIGYLIVKCASFRKESRGLHYNTDYPQAAALIQNIVL
ncbi:MAG: L-aspartate oxidase [Bacteroidetes bacterium]|nr:L-aspartate oxidase [Bacteroidota bacterium]